jgi:hypothetical protein
MKFSMPAGKGEGAAGEEEEGEKEEEGERVAFRWSDLA